MKEITIYTIALSLLLPFQMTSAEEPVSDFFEDFEPQDISITPGGVLKILSGATVEMQMGGIATGVWDFGGTTSVKIPQLTLGSAGATITTAIDASNADIFDAISIGENRIKGTHLLWDGGGQFVLGTAGTGIITFKGGGGIDTTGNGDIKLSPHGSGIIDIPTGVTFRPPQSSPNENKNGLYWDEATSKLCIDKSSDQCTTALDEIKLSIDNTTSGDIGTAFEIITSGVGATITTAIDVSDADIFNAISIGENRIAGTYFVWDGGGQLALGTAGTGLVTFKGGGGIDTTGNGDIKLSPHGSGIIDIPTGVTLRLPQSSPKENKNGLYWDAPTNRLCVDKTTDICTAVLTLLSSDTADQQQAVIEELVKHPEGFKKWSSLISKSENIDKLAMLSQMVFPEKEKNEEMGYFPGNFITDPSDRGSAQLIDGEIFIELDSRFRGNDSSDGNDVIPYTVQITPTSLEMRGPLVVQKSERGFKVIDSGGKSEATFDWEVKARDYLSLRPH